MIFMKMKRHGGEKPVARKQAIPKPLAPDLWKVFNLAENNPDRGGGMLYLLRYGSENLKEHQKVIISVLEAMPVEIEDVGEGLGIKPKRHLTEAEFSNLKLFLEELSVVNEALEYAEGGFEGVDSIRALKDKLIVAFLGTLSAGNKIAAYDLFDITGPEIIRDMRYADRNGGVLSEEDRAALNELQDYAAHKVKTLGGRSLVLIG